MMHQSRAIALSLAFAASGVVAYAQEPTPAVPIERPNEATHRASPTGPGSMSELLDLVREGFRVETEENRQREEEFLRSQEEQERLLAEALALLASEEESSQLLEEVYSNNDQVLAKAAEDLAEQLGQLGELFGIVRQVATDLAGQTWDSLTSSQITGRQNLLERLGRSTELPSTEDMERLWFELQREMVEQGRVVRYPTIVLTTGGRQEEMEVIRAGPFAAIANGRYLLWEPRQQSLRELGRQPPSRYVQTVPAFETAEPGIADLALDPTRGSLLNALIDTPSATERVQQGGAVGYVIIALGVIALTIGLVRWVVVSVVNWQVSAQQKKDEPSARNPLGRVLQIYRDNPDLDTEELELKMDAVLLREVSKLERFLWLVKVGAAVAPLLGLLGTVTGMIQTFQSITLFGAGDPKMMAGGISEALVTTMLGLTVAIPLVLLHAAVFEAKSRVIDILEEQSAGLIALRAEGSNARD